MSSETLVRVKRVSNGVVGVEVELPNSPPLVILVGRRAFVACGFLNVELAEKLGIPCARVTGVRSVEDVLEKEVQQVTSKAKELGVIEGVKVKEVLDKL